MGQELTARTHSQGMVRKRLFPVLLTANVTSPPQLALHNMLHYNAANAFYSPTLLSVPNEKVDAIPRDTPIMLRSNDNNEEVGRLLSQSTSVALAQIRIEAVTRLYPKASLSSDVALYAQTCHAFPYAPTYFPVG